MICNSVYNNTNTSSLSKIVHSEALSPIYEIFQRYYKDPEFRIGISIVATLAVVSLSIYSLFVRNIKKPQTKEAKIDNIGKSSSEEVKVGDHSGVLLETTPQTKEEKRYVFNEFLTPEECEHLLGHLAINSNRLQKAVLLSPDGTVKENSTNRKAETLSLLPNKPNEKWASDKIGLIIQKICTLAGHLLNKNPESIKSLLEFCIIIKYTKNEGCITAHYDDSVPKPRPRDLTMLVYLNDLTEGGETHFIIDNTSVTPEEGKLLCFNNHPQNAPNRNCCLHEGRIPKSGNKIVLAATVMGDFQDKQIKNIGRNQENPPPLPPFPDTKVSPDFSVFNYFSLGTTYFLGTTTGGIS